MVRRVSDKWAPVALAVLGLLGGGGILERRGHDAKAAVDRHEKAEQVNEAMVILMRDTYERGVALGLKNCVNNREDERR